MRALGSGPDLVGAAAVSAPPHAESPPYREHAPDGWKVTLDTRAATTGEDMIDALAQVAQVAALEVGRARPPPKTDPGARGASGFV